MTVFSIDSKKLFRTGTALLCTSMLLYGCSPAHDSTEELPLHPDTTAEETTDIFMDPTQILETALPQTQPQETIDISQALEKASIEHKGYDGAIGDYSFRECNETQIFGDYSISHASYDGEDYFMLSYNGISLLAKEDGTHAKLFYQEQQLELPFSCQFELDNQFISLHRGDFAGIGSEQLALIVPMENGSGIDVEELHLIDLTTMTVMPSYTQATDYKEQMYQLFDDHFSSTEMTASYSLFNYVQFYIQDNLIFAEYGACDDDYIYLCFLEAAVEYREDSFQLGADMTFLDEFYCLP